MRLDAFRVNGDFCVFSNGIPMIVAGFERSLQYLKGFGGSLTYSYGRLKMEAEEMQDGISHSGNLVSEKFSCFYTPIYNGKEKFYHMLAVNTSLKGELTNGQGRFLTTRKMVAEDFYNYLMHNFSLPLLKKWAPALFDRCKYKGLIVDNAQVCVSKRSVVADIPWKGHEISLKDLMVVSISGLTIERLKEVIKELFDEGLICITSVMQKKLEFENMDQYFEKYGVKLVDNLKKQIVPLTELDGSVKDFTLKHLWMYPQQVAQVNGALALLDKSRYMIMNHGMGTGKTLCGASLCEGYFGRKWLKCHPGKTLRDMYQNPENIRYRNIVMAPGHLVKKWAREIEENVPYSNVTILNDFSQLVALRNHGKERNGREWYVISKDFGKLSYQEIPAPSKVRMKPVYLKYCSQCGEIINKEGCFCEKCKKEVTVSYVKTKRFSKGLVCPDCNRLLFPVNGEVDYGPEVSEEELTRPLLPTDFAVHNQLNDSCFYCGSKLWTPNVGNLGGACEKKWKRLTAWTNKAHKGKKTLWVHRDYIPETERFLTLETISIKEAKGVRKYSPTLFIKKYMRGFFDIAVFDEAHMYKGGGTGQGHAMHCLVKASKKQLALTGTIAGGYANHFFYLLWRLEPQRMVKKGYTFRSEMQFSEDYGCVEREFTVSENTNQSYNVSCHGRQVSSPKVRPGISPLIFMDFLLDRCTFLDLSDMSKYLPTLKENVVEISPKEGEEETLFHEYSGICASLMQRVRSEDGRGLLGTAIQFGLSFMDKPFGVSPIKSPVTGSIVSQVPDCEVFQGKLLSKEEALIDILNKELSEGRNCVVYAEYTASPETCISYRLKDVIERKCNLTGKVEILESSSPVPAKREEWMHEKARKGTRVFITNPRCVETGLDFCWSEDGKEYNYPTIIFYQIGSSMFTISQASRRHYRLNQRKECRTYYMAWKGTAQAAMIKLIAEKQVATSAIQGKFSTEGLAAMAAGVDTRLKLASAMSGRDTKTENDLQGMFDVLNSTEDSSELDGVDRMLLLHELLGDDVASPRTVEESEQHDGYDLFGMMFPSGAEEQKKVPKSESNSPDVIKGWSCELIETGAKKKAKASGQFVFVW